ncbi:hypothetical protein SD78_3918 [Bacillus badius]|nr:hypothetical protein SD78_3918 [Bacillus badius]
MLNRNTLSRLSFIIGGLPAAVKLIPLLPFHDARCMSDKRRSAHFLVMA